MKCGTFLLAVLVAALPACSVRQANAINTERGNVSETLEISMAPAHVPAAIRALQADPALDDRQVSIQIGPIVAPRRTSDVETGIYVAALGDARAKAETIASRLGLRLGSVKSVEEIAPQSFGAGFAGARGTPEGVIKSVTLSAPANGVVTLAVTFDAGGVPISVFGVHAGAVPQSALRDATGISLTIRARAEDLRSAESHLRAIASSVRTIARGFGATDSDIVVSAADANTY